MKNLVPSFAEFINESQDVDLFFENLQKQIEKSGGFFYEDEYDSDTFVFAVSSKKLSSKEIQEMFDDGRPSNNLTTFMYAIPPEQISDKAIKEIQQHLNKIKVNVDVVKVSKQYL